MTRVLTAVFALIALAGMASPACADGPEPVSRDHEVMIGGARIDYVASFERFDVNGLNGQVGGNITTIAYLRKVAKADRPLVFAFNGGPGSASIYLNLGFLGPQRIDFPADPAANVPSRPPLVENGDSILDVADVVMIDPVGVGFSELTNESARSYFYSVNGDGRSVAEAIQKWVAKHQRENSPIYLLGESYGTIRAVATGHDLVDTSLSVNLRGVILVSQSQPILDTVQRRSNVVGQVVGMPTLAATAWYHKLAGKGMTLEAFLDAAKEFAHSQWLPALFAGTSLSEEKRNRVAAGLSRYTGVPVSYFLEHDLYLSKEAYRRIAFGDRHVLLGIYDTRYTGPLDNNIPPDASLTTSFKNSWIDLWKDQFGIDVSAEPYKSSFKNPANVSYNWKYVDDPFVPFFGDTYAQADYAKHLMDLMERLPWLRVNISGGLYDTAASSGADDYLMSRPGLDLSRISHKTYPGGHMFYTDAISRTDYANLLRKFIADAH